ncbi:helix-turn-helix domain-containing protein [Pedobacter nanyangensis]|uniref:helix-turn-helix domain-containing protein n=1 Tax=Pedobacter nanyangensis TaxID=1562389 RepID=UPI000DE234DC|nr:helix-turn-helix domain-containing protein [Pedobacter nanyangensis]
MLGNPKTVRNKEKFLQQYFLSGMNTSKASEMAKLSRQHVYDWIANDSEFKKRLADIDKKFENYAYSQLMVKACNKDSKALKVLYDRSLKNTP